MSKLGFHVIGGASPAALAEARPRVVVLPPDPAVLIALHDALGQQTLLIARPGSLPPDWGTFWRGPAHHDADRALDLWWEAAWPGVEAAPFAFWAAFDAPTDRGLIEPFAAFEAARVERLAEAGSRACIGGFLTGQPALDDRTWEAFLPACRAARRQGGVLGLQEFGALYLWTGYASNEWLGNAFRQERKFPAEHSAEAALALRYRRLRARLLEPAGLGDLALVITACGLTRTAEHITAALSADGAPTGGWRSCAATWRKRDGEHDPDNFYMRQLQWYEAQLERDPYVLGAAVYACGSGDDHEIEGRVGEMLSWHLRGAPPRRDAWPQPGGPLFEPGAAGGMPPTLADDPAVAPRRAADRLYFIRVAHPEVFDALWRQGEPAADAARALLTWREEGGRFVLRTDDAAIWRELYLYGQMLAQSFGSEIEGGEQESSAQDV